MRRIPEVCGLVFLMTAWPVVALVLAVWLVVLLAQTAAIVSRG